jgi:hypothetical protein
VLRSVFIELGYARPLVVPSVALPTFNSHSTLSLLDTKRPIFSGHVLFLFVLNTNNCGRKWVADFEVCV